MVCCVLSSLCIIKIEMFSNAAPVKKYPYRTTPQIREKMENMIKEQIAQGLLEACDNGAWSSVALLSLFHKAFEPPI